METIILVVHLVIVVALILVILLQRSGQDGLSGLGGGSGAGSNALFNIRGKANVLSRATGILATIFLTTSLTLAYFATHSGNSILDKVNTDTSVTKTVTEGEAAKTGGKAATPVEEKPVAPVVPLAN